MYSQTLLKCNLLYGLYQYQPYSLVMKADSLHGGFTLETDLQKWLWYIFFQSFQRSLSSKLLCRHDPLHSSGQLPLPHSYNTFTESSLPVSQASLKPLLGHRCTGDGSAGWGRCSAPLPHPCLCLPVPWEQKTGDVFNTSSMTWIHSRRFKCNWKFTCSRENLCLWHETHVIRTCLQVLGSGHFSLPFSSLSTSRFSFSSVSWLVKICACCTQGIFGTKSWGDKVSYFPSLGQATCSGTAHPALPALQEVSGT